MFSTGRRIKAPERGLLTMHPFVDVLEGRSLLTATAHDGVLAVESVVEAAPPAAASSPWSSEATATAAEPAAAVNAATALARQAAPAVIELEPETTAAAFGTRTIGDTPWALFGNALRDRRGAFDPQPLPTAEQLAAAYAAPDSDFAFAAGRSMTGAMMPFLTMSADQANHPFAA